MNEAGPQLERVGPAAQLPDASPAPDAPGWEVRLATREDLPGIATAVRELLAELGGRPAAPAALLDGARAVLEDDSAGTLLVARTDEGRIVGLLGASWPLAVRVAGRYGLIEELWVDPSLRRGAIGSELLAALCALARERGVQRIEVGLPSERFANLAATEAFYRERGFTPIGTRMRRALK